MPYADRRAAGRALARHLAGHATEDALVLGLPRGGVPVAAEIASALDLPLDVWVARKLGAPSNPEFGVGAIGPGDVRILDERAIDMLGIPAGVLDQIAHDEAMEMERRLALYRGDPRPPDVAGRDIILVDDGLATGVTARAAVESLRRLGASRVTLAVPVGAPDSVELLRHVADDVVCPEQPEDFRAVGLWYDDFRQTTDEEVIAALGPRAREVRIPVGGDAIVGDLTVPNGARGLVLFAHGSGSGRKSPRNREVAQRLQREGLATLLVDLLTEAEARVDERTRQHRFDIDLLARRLVAAVDWLRAEPTTREMTVGLYGASTGAAAALVAAAERREQFACVVSRGGRPDLAGPALSRAWAPTLLIVGGEDHQVLELNEQAYEQIPGEKRLEIVPGATHLFEEPGTLEAAARLAADFLRSHLAPGSTTPARAPPRA